MAAKPQAGVPSVAPVVAPAVAPPRTAPAATAPPPPKDDSIALENGGLGQEQLDALGALHASLGELDYYQILKVSQDASPTDVKRAFYRESRSMHPDRFYHLTDAETKERIVDIYKRITEAYYVLRDDAKRRRYTAEINGPERAQKLRFTEASEAETKAAAKKQQEEEIGTHPKGRQFYATAMGDVGAERWGAAERNLKMALTFEPQNPRYKSKLAEVQAKQAAAAKGAGDPFKIR